MTSHELKVLPEFFKELYSGRKTFEIRKNDRDFERGDLLTLREWQPSGVLTAHYTGRAVLARVNYILYGGQFGIDPDYCVMSLQILERCPT